MTIQIDQLLREKDPAAHLRTRSHSAIGDAHQRLDAYVETCTGILGRSENPWGAAFFFLLGTVLTAFTIGSAWEGLTPSWRSALAFVGAFWSLCVSSFGLFAITEDFRDALRLLWERWRCVHRLRPLIEAERQRRVLELRASTPTTAQEHRDHAYYLRALER